MNRGNNHMSIFTRDDDFRFYLKKLAELKAEYPFELYHYCLMQTHSHFLVKITRRSDFSNFSKRLNLSYSSYYQRAYGLVGHLWQGRFKSQLISNDPYFIQCGKYIELNPVEADMVKNPEDYPWSSYRYYALAEENDLITKNIFYNELGTNNKERRKEYRNMVIGGSISDHIDGTNAVAIGSDKFVYNANRRAKYHKVNKNTPYRKRGV